MQCIVEGVLLEKQSVDKEYEGKPVRKKVFMLFQRGERNNPQVTVSEETFDKYAEGDKVTVYCRAGAYAFNNKAGISLVEVVDGRN